MAESSPSLRRLLVVASVVTLAVTLLRLAGELARWSPALFNREAGGPGALVGIVWLIPVFGVSCWIAIAVARPAWPALWRVLLAYGLAARIPVVVVMFLAIFLGWDSHYAKARPDFPPMGPWGSSPGRHCFPRCRSGST